MSWMLALTAGASILGGIMGSSASKKAAKQKARAERESAALQYRMFQEGQAQDWRSFEIQRSDSAAYFNQGRGDSAAYYGGARGDSAAYYGAARQDAASLYNIQREQIAPYYTTGTSALNELADLYGIDNSGTLPGGELPGFSLPGFSLPGGEIPGYSAETGGAPGGGLPGVSADGPNLTAGIVGPGGGAQWLPPERQGTAPGGGGADVSAEMDRLSRLPIFNTAFGKAAFKTMGPQLEAKLEAKLRQAGGQDFNDTAIDIPGIDIPGVDIAGVDIPDVNVQREGTIDERQASAFDDFFTSPQYEFNKRESIEGAERSAAARGSLRSGGTMQEIARYSSGLASGEFNNYVKILGDLAGVGERAASSGMAPVMPPGAATGGAAYGSATSPPQFTGNAVAASQGIGRSITGAGAAEAEGTMGANYAWQRTLEGVGSSAARYGGGGFGGQAKPWVNPDLVRYGAY